MTLAGLGTTGRRSASAAGNASAVRRSAAASTAAVVAGPSSASPARGTSWSPWTSATTGSPFLS